MNNNKEICTQKGENLEFCLDQLRYHLSQVVEKSNDLRPNADLSPSYENFLKICNEVQKKLHIHDPTINKKQNKDDTERCLDKICDCTSDVEQSEEKSEKQQLLSSCKQIKVKMEGQKSDGVQQTAGSDKDKQGNIQVNTALTSGNSKNESIFGLVKRMISDRQFFKAKNECENKELPPSDDPLSKIVDQLNETQNLAREAKKNGCMSDSLEEFIKSCEKLKHKLAKKRLKILMEKTCCDKTKVGNEENICDLITQLKAITLVSDSIETFLRAQLIPQAVCETEIFENNDIATNTSVEITLFLKHTEILDDATGSGGLVCQKNNQNKKNKDMNIKAEQKAEPAECCLKQKNPELSESDDNSLGLYEKNVHKIVKVTRTLEDDGKVLEKKQVTVIKRNRHDPKETQFPEVSNINDDSGTIVEKTVRTIKK